MKKALVIGVGPLNGLGGQLCRKIANNNFEVFVAGRTRSSLDNVVNTILNDGNKAIPIVVDATDENQIKNMINEIGPGLDFAVYNVGNSRPGKIVEMDANYFRESWESGCFGGFLLLKKLLKHFYWKKQLAPLFLLVLVHL